MKRILLIGAKGMLGRDLLPVVQESFPEAVIQGWDIEEIDIRREEETRSRIEGLGPDLILLAAAYTDVDGCEQNGDHAFQVNAEGVKHVALGASRCGAKVVYLSTDYVFDGQKGEPYREEDLPNPMNVYGRSKWKGEQYLQKYLEDHLIVRTQWLYGRHGKNFVSTILRLAEERPVLNIVNDQTGSPTYTVDLARAIVTLIGHGCRGLFHVVNEGSCTWHAFARTILEQAHRTGIQVVPISSRELGRPAPRPSYSVLDTRKITRETGLGLRPWPEALSDYLRSIGTGTPFPPSGLKQKKG
jgi:dTDP-4-dehydrorhamnose reductase